MVEPSGALQGVFDRAVTLAKSYKHEYVTLEHMLFSMCEDEKDMALILMISKHT
jgi:ATP-dependent Clp protease ATP-binding subunit ClpA